MMRNEHLSTIMKTITDKVTAFVEMLQLSVFDCPVSAGESTKVYWASGFLHL